jgi:hypothetical protein
MKILSIKLHAFEGFAGESLMILHMVDWEPIATKATVKSK